MAPDDLKTRGTALWRDCGADALGATLQGLVHEAGRLLDRLDRLHALLQGREDFWVQVYPGEDGEVTLVVDKMLGEARQYALAFERLMARLHAFGVIGKKEDEPGGSGLFDELERKRRERERLALGGQPDAASP